MAFIVLLIIIFVVVFVAALLQNSANSQKENERKEALNRTVASVSDFEESVSVTGLKGLYKFSVDKKHRKVLYVKGTFKQIIPFEKILSVSVNEDNTTVVSKSSLRTIGGAVVGGALAGGAGTIVGGLSGNSTMKKNVSNVQVIIKLRDLNTPSITIDCFNSRTMTIEGKSEIKADGMEGHIYKTGLQHAQKIADLISVIIDMEDKKKQNNPQSSSNASSIVADLEKLATLKEKGILTEEEFNSQKKLLLENGNQQTIEEDNLLEEIVSDEIPSDVKEAIDNGQKLLAVKRYVNATGVGLAEAKKFVEEHSNL